MGLPGAGKTTLAIELALKAKRINADEVRKKRMIGTFQLKEGIDKLKEWQNKLLS